MNSDAGRSLMGASWIYPDADIDAVSRVMQRHDLPEPMARLLIQRGIDENQIESFLNPTFQRDFPSPFTFAGMGTCASDIADAVIAQKNIAIFGDFDVDGATSSAVIHRFLKHCGVDTRIYIPERLTEGYGPNETALKSLRDEGTDILLMLDCGTGSHDTIKAGQDYGLQIVVLDHHEAGTGPSPAWHLINPKRPDDTSGLDMLAAVGVCFFFCVAVNAKLREKGFYQDKAEPNLKSLLDLVALGTVCDIVPLQGVNRLLVRQGFAKMDQQQNTGIAALAQVAGITPPFNPYHAGYVLGPRVNAGSRVGQSSLGARLFTLDANQAEEAKNIAWTLNDCNDKRKDMQADMESQAVKMVEDQNLADQPVIILAAEGWHSGLTGLVAGRLKERYKKPCCVICIEDGVGKASGRSIAGIHLGHIFVKAMEQKLAIKGGGHAMAGGFTVAEDDIDSMKSFITQEVQAQMDANMPVISYQVDSLITARGAMNVGQIKLLHEKIGPFGAGFEEPLFLLKNVKLSQVGTMGSDGSHIKAIVSDAEGGGRLKAVAFKAADTPLGQAVLTASYQHRFDLLGTLKLNVWQGRESVDLHLVDAKKIG